MRTDALLTSHHCFSDVADSLRRYERERGLLYVGVTAPSHRTMRTCDPQREITVPANQLQPAPHLTYR